MYWFLQAELEDCGEDDDILELQEKCQEAALEAKWSPLVCPRPPTFELSGTGRMLRMMSSASKRLLPLVGPSSVGNQPLEKEKEDLTKVTEIGDSGGESVAVADLENSLHLLNKTAPGTKVQQMTDALLKKFRELATREGGRVKSSQLVDEAKEISAGHARLTVQILSYFKKGNKEGATQNQVLVALEGVPESEEVTSEAGESFATTVEETDLDLTNHQPDNTLKGKFLKLVRKEKQVKQQQTLGDPRTELKETTNELRVPIVDPDETLSMKSEQTEEILTGESIDHPKVTWGLGSLKIMREPTAERGFLGKFLHRRSDSDAEKEKVNSVPEVTGKVDPEGSIVPTSMPASESTPVQCVDPPKDEKAGEGILSKWRNSIPFGSNSTSPENADSKNKGQKEEVEGSQAQEIGKEKEDDVSGSLAANNGGILRKFGFFKLNPRETGTSTGQPSIEVPESVEKDLLDNGDEKSPGPRKELLASSLLNPPSPARFFRKLIKEEEAVESERTKELLMENGVLFDPISPSASAQNELLKASPGGIKGGAVRLSSLVQSWRTSGVSRKTSPVLEFQNGPEQMEPLSLDPTSPVKNQKPAFHTKNMFHLVRGQGEGTGGEIGGWGRQLGAKVASGLKLSVSAFPNFKGPASQGKNGEENLEQNKVRVGNVVENNRAEGEREVDTDGQSEADKRLLQVEFSSLYPCH